MSTEPHKHEDLISRYVDGAMDQSERAAFEARLAEDDGVRRQLALQRELDASLRRTFGRAPQIRVPAPAAAALTGDRPGRRFRLWTGLGLAALIALATFIGWQAGVLRPATPLERLYAMKRADSFSYIWACADDQEFIEHTTTTFGQPMVADSTPTARVVGWDYVPESWDASIGLLVAKVEGRDVLVLIQQPTSPPVSTRTHGGLSVFSRTLGQVTLHEVTPLDRAGAITLFRQP